MPPDLSDKQGAPVDPPPSTERPHLLVIRFQDGDHSRFPLLRRILVNGVRYRWVGCYAGQRKCGHQIGIASADGCWRHLIIGDADLHKDGVGPVHINFEGDKWRNKKAWWGALEYLVHVTKFGPDLSEFCNLSPHNRPDDELDKYRGQKRGKNSIDMLYFSDLTGSHGDSLSGDSFRSSSTRSSPLERTTRGSFPASVLVQDGLLHDLTGVGKHVPLAILLLKYIKKVPGRLVLKDFLQSITHLVWFCSSWGNM